ncbi:MAG: DUF1501 domain-containing protein [Planctomycetaceae bacterium]|nr:DUF1501 domain-containing protein [Planctomycetaceae bacterium]
MSTAFDRDYSRRDFLQMSLAGMLGVSYSGWFGKLAAAAAASGERHRSCILLWMSGGPSQLDTFDLKPGHKNGGPYAQIESSVPGVKISEHLPGLAKHMQHMALVRGMTSKEGDHARATYLMLTGYREQEAVRYPALGSMVAKELGKEDHELPNFVSISPQRFGGGGGSGFLGPQFAPLVVSGASDNPLARANMSVENLLPPTGVTERSLENRFALLDFLQTEFGTRYKKSEAAAAHRANYERAVRMVKTQAKSAFKLEDESPALRDAYGRNRFGQGCLLARRLIERGVPFVEVTLSGAGNNGAGWDTHGNNFDLVKNLSEVLDPAWATLMQDLKDRGLLDATLIVWMGEFGRTPVINAQNGRDHFPVAWSTVLAGAGIRGGQAYGDTGASGMQVEKNPVTVPEFMATICSALGIDPTKENITEEGRPIPIVERGGHPINDLLAQARA